MKWVWKCTRRPWLHQFGWCDWVGLVIHLEAIVVWCRGHGCESSGIHYEFEIVITLGCTWRLWLSEIGGGWPGSGSSGGEWSGVSWYGGGPSGGGHSGDGQSGGGGSGGGWSGGGWSGGSPSTGGWTGGGHSGDIWSSWRYDRCWDFILRFVTLQLWGCEKLTFSLNRHEVHDGGGQSVGIYARSWGRMYGSTCNCGNEWKTVNLGWLLYSVYVVLSVNPLSWHGYIQNDKLTWGPVIIAEWWIRTRCRRRGRAQHAGYDAMCEICGMTSFIGFRNPHIGGSTFRMGHHPCHIRNGILTPTRNSLNFQHLRKISHVSSHLSLSQRELYYQLRTWR